MKSGKLYFFSGFQLNLYSQYQRESYTRPRHEIRQIIFLFWFSAVSIFTIPERVLHQTQAWDQANYISFLVFSCIYIHNTRESPTPDPGMRSGKLYFFSGFQLYLYSQYQRESYTRPRHEIRQIIFLFWFSAVSIFTIPGIVLLWDPGMSSGK